ncbi:hypothetical protein Z946_3049 [Sulfitobacter noctilucicola]|uniref:Uncharacterized protein n=1 Tax=Sulfitobacter noctilucicola TaxID=1342301 RepID=A0A7W6MAR8_9RHOB|nr:hypothetical protein Z946_3049 [Sulfitobacter noctilucicola]MBB4175514.1 hypothetical protein [Sulfitobacter noctilucicola]
MNAQSMPDAKRMACRAPLFMWDDSATFARAAAMALKAPSLSVRMHGEKHNAVQTCSAIAPPLSHKFWILAAGPRSELER